MNNGFKGFPPGHIGASFAEISSGTNVTATMVLGNGASLNVAPGGNLGVSTISDSNTIAGFDAGGMLAAGDTNNTFIGNSCALATAGVVGNTGVGSNAFYSLTTGSINTAFGNAGLSGVTSGSHNVGLGYNTGPSNLTIGTNNILVGDNSDTAANGTINAIVVGGGSSGGDTSVIIGNAKASAATNDLIIESGDTGLRRNAAHIIGPTNGTGGAGDIWLPSSALTAGTMTVTKNAIERTAITHFSWTNAMVVALGASMTGNIAICTLPAKTVVKNCYVVITTAAGGTATLTVSVGRTSAVYSDYIVAKDAQATANTVYGAVSGDRGTNLTGYDLPSYTGTTVVNAHFISTVANLSAVTTSTGEIFLETCTLP